MRSTWSEWTRKGSCGSVASMPAPSRNAGHAASRTAGDAELTAHAHHATSKTGSARRTDSKSSSPLPSCRRSACSPARSRRGRAPRVPSRRGQAHVLQMVHRHQPTPGPWRARRMLMPGHGTVATRLQDRRQPSVGAVGLEPTLDPVLSRAPLPVGLRPRNRRQPIPTSARGVPACARHLGSTYCQMATQCTADAAMTNR